MKLLILITSLCFVSFSFAKEVETDCKAMNETTKVKNLSSVKTKSNTSKGSSIQ